MRPRITIDRFGPGWICRHFVTNTIGSGSTPSEAFAAWQVHVAKACRPLPKDGDGMYWRRNANGSLTASNQPFTKEIA